MSQIAPQRPRQLQGTPKKLPRMSQIAPQRPRQLQGPVATDLCCNRFGPVATDSRCNTFVPVATEISVANHSLENHYVFCVFRCNTFDATHLFSQHIRAANVLQQMCCNTCVPVNLLQRPQVVPDWRGQNKDIKTHRLSLEQKNRFRGAVQAFLRTPGHPDFEPIL